MFDFRYHAISLAAVLVALVVGVLLGVAIGDAGLVSSAEQSVRDSLRGDVRAAQDERREAQDALGAEQRYSEAAYPLLVADRLPGERIGLLFLGRPSETIARDVRNALDGTGARLTGTMALREPPDLAALAEAADGTRYADLEQDPALLEDFGRRIGIQLVQGGRLLRRERDALFSTRAGSLGPFDALVIARSPRELEGDAERQTADLEDGIVAGLRENPVSVVGVETSEADPSQVPWFRERDLTSVDNIDQVAGRAALVFALAGATGTFGVGPQAESLLPAPESAGAAG
ncbi:MAG: copper transporter [Solirubrobacteraceae bacterium]|nr:copper transporter [Solirubrobacteraceae bacterium]